MGNNNQKFGIIADFDNTLVATNKFVVKHLINTCLKMGLECVDESKLLDILRQNPPFEKIFTDLFGAKGEEVLAAYRKTAMETLYEETSGGNIFVQIMVDQGVPMIIVSNRVNKLEERLIQAGYDPKSFLSILKAEPVKPDQHAYDPAIVLLSDKEIIIIGDHTDDYLACPDNLRSNFIAITTGLTTAEEFEKVGVAKDKIWQKLEAQRLLLI